MMEILFVRIRLDRHLVSVKLATQVMEQIVKVTN